MDPLVDGYLTNMFGSADAEAYYSNLLKRETRLLRPYNLPNYPGIFFAAPPLRPDLNPTPPQTPWVIDYAVRNWGTVIKQQIWVTRNQHEFLRPPIFFVHKNGGLGLPLIQAARGDCMSLNGASSRAPLDAASSTHAQIRIHWRGYHGWDDQILIRTQAHAPEIVKLERFVMHVARKVYRFMTEIAPSRPYNGDPRWFINPGVITPEHVVLIGVIQVSRGSWMPILQLNRFVL